MSKVYLEKVQKARMLAQGLKKNYELVKNLGITMEQIEQLEKDADEAAVYNEELDKLREEVSRQVARANKKLDEIRVNVMTSKSIIKRKFEQPQWAGFGIADKR